jgi:L-lactate dehydrogenase
VKVAIIGGGGRVGSCAAFALQCGGVVSEIQILDANKDMADGEALDLLHGSAFSADQRIYSGDYPRAADSDIFLITAGLRRKPDESRLDLINRNVTLFLQILDSMRSAGLRKDAIIFVVSNPVDIPRNSRRGALGCHGSRSSVSARCSILRGSLPSSPMN